MKSKIIIFALIIALVSAGFIYASVKRGHQEPAGCAAGSACEDDHAAGGHGEDEHSEEAHSGVEIAGLELAPAIAGEGWDTVVATGKIVVPSDGLVKISPRIDGKVVAAYGTVGDTVRRGQVLAVISSVELAEARAEYRRASARLQAAQKNLEQEQKIAKLGANSKRPVEEARGESLSAQGDLADAKSELAQARSELAQTQSELAQCKARLERARELYADKIVSRQDLETAEAEYKRDTAAVDSAKSKVTRAESQVDKAEAKLSIAKQYLSREEKVYENKVVDTRAVQAAQADVTNARIDVQSAADRIKVLGASPSGSGETLSIVSPVAGRIVSRNTNVGEMASPSDALFTVANLSRVWVEADVYEKDLARVRRGQSVEIRVATYPDQVFSGKIDSIDDVLSSESRTAKVRCVVSNPQGMLRGEMFARVTVVTAKRGDTVLIPKVAVLDDTGKKIAFTPCLECPEDIKAGANACGAYDKLELTTGAVQGDKIEVLSGVEPGTMVVTTGAYQLKTALGSGKLEAGCSH